MPGWGKEKGPSKEEIWSGLAGRLGGEVRMDRRGRKLQEVRFSAGEWKVTLDTMVQSNGQTSQTYTRIRGLYSEQKPLRFRAYTKSIFSGLGKALGMQDIEVGHPAVDPGWIIKGDSEGQIRSLMILPQVVAGLSALKSARFEIRRFKRSAPDIRELRLTIPGVMTDEAKLEAAIAMMFTALAHFVRAGVAAPDAPGVEP